ncbi:MAG: hypothetical protein Ct9H90mP20_7090 [Candidatus Neomarinimicrobiota bacterium]|nr:MAG: hypothetical protein Ct9H90mP20_7090 [Candidatus Neomarinimicrobiota bacterium]
MPRPVHQGTWSVDGKHVFGTALNMKVRHPVYMFNMYGKKHEIIPADHEPLLLILKCIQVMVYYILLMAMEVSTGVEIELKPTI